MTDLRLIDLPSSLREDNDVPRSADMTISPSEAEHPSVTIAA